ncbi:LysR family transcriptional regulator [Brevibacterium sp. RIT 803]|uniref:LysR family transcriptional regulator n=1 Tax=Brevibacterium sp. RIT 803 TaxID=2810210 RepID=UPI0019500F3E|nr:LysR family transcriptional regulator [Brevibacterium sp. RIT 803]MBM6592218.1 LysR family transcriptional regulator [Brevibacterium sp. RIT 803]
MEESLRYLRAIIDQGNLTRAAESLFISQPALSRYLSRLERSVGVVLIDRTNQPLELTPEGHRYYEYLVAVNRLRSRMETDLADMGQLAGETVRLGATTWRSEILLPRALSAILRHHPELQISFFGLSNADLMGLVRSKNLDLAVMSAVRAGAGVDFHMITEEEVVVAGEVLKTLGDHAGSFRSGSCVPAAKLKPILQSQRLILMHADHNLGAIVSDFLTRLGVKPRKVIRGSSVSAGVQLSAHSAGLTFVPIQAVIRQGYPNVPFVRIAEADLVQTVGLAWPSDAKPRGRVAELASVLEEELLLEHAEYQNLL